MNLLTIEHLTKSYTGVFFSMTHHFLLMRGDKIGLIGINGTGNPPSLRLQQGWKNRIWNRGPGRNLYIRYLPQNPIFEPQLTVLECVIKENEGHEHVWDLEGQAKNMLTRLGCRSTTL